MVGAVSHPQATVGLPLHADFVAAHARHRHDVRVLHDGTGEGREHARRVAQLARELAGAVGRIGRNVSGGPGGRLYERGRCHVVEAQPVGVAQRAIGGDARVSGRPHHIGAKVARGRVALGARRAGRDMVRRLGAAAHLIGGKRRAGRVAAVAVTAGRMGLVVCLGTGVAPGGRGAHHHPQIRRGLVTGRAGAHHRHGGVAGDAERRSTDTRRTDTEAPGVHVRGAVAARAVAIHAADRKVIARCGHDRDVGKGLRHRRTVAGEAPGHALVRAGDGVEREVARRRVALGAGRSGRNVIRRLAGGRQQVGRERGRRDVAVAAVAGGRMLRIQGGVRTGVSRRGRGADHHAQVLGAFVTARAGAHHGQRRMPRDVQCRSGDARVAELEAAAARIDVACGVTARAVAIHVADRNVIARLHHHREDRVGGNIEGAGAVALHAPAHALVGAGGRVGREVARGRMALRARCAGRNVIGGLRGRALQIRRERGRRGMAAGTVTRGRMLRVECGWAGVSRRGRGAGDHSHIGRALVTGRARAHGCDRGVAGDVERRSTDIRRTDMEATGIHVRSAVAARAVAVGAPDRDVAGARPPHNRDRVAGRRSRERSGARAVAGDAPGHALVRAGNGIQRPVARRRVALRAQRIGRNVVRRARRGGVEEGGRVMAQAAIARGGVQAIELRRGARVPRGGVGARVHPLEVPRLVAARAGERRHRRVVDDAGVPRRVVGGRVAALARC